MYRTIMAVRDSHDNIIAEIGQIAKVRMDDGKEYTGRIKLLLGTGFFLDVSKIFEKFVKYSELSNIEKLD